VAGHNAPDGAAIGVIEIPVLHLDQVLVQGTSAADLMKGPGLMPGSALPGSPGNAVVAGRRVTFGGPFGAIGQLRTGDRIHTVDGAGSFTYRVSKVEVVTAGQRDVVTPTADTRLTADWWCWPGWWDTPWPSRPASWPCPGTNWA
jgi:LPXTG-site transpeptidase (sortase) family protein